MSSRLRTISIVVCALAVLFGLFFDISKHHPFLSPVNPFASDPYDAIGSFATELVIFLALFVLFQAFLLYRKELPNKEQILFLIRAQMTIVLAVWVTLSGDLVAMMRHMNVWSGSTAGSTLLKLVLGLAFLAALAGLVVLSSARELPAVNTLKSWKKRVLVLILFFAVLFLYPERIQESTPGTLFTVVVGAFLLFIPVRAWGDFLLPGSDAASQPITSWWIGVAFILIGIPVGFSLVLLELVEGGGGVNIMGSLFIISIYIGLEVTGIIIGYAFLGKFLGLAQITRLFARNCL